MRAAKHVSFRTYLVAAFAVCLVALGIVMVVTTASGFERQRERTSMELRAAARYNGELADDGESSILALLEGVNEQPGITAFDPARCEAVLSGLSTIVEQAHLHVFRADASPVCSLQAPDLRGRDLPKGPWFDEAVSTGEPVDAGAGIDPLSGQPAVTVAMPVPGDDGSTGAVAAVVYTAVPPLDLPAGASKEMVVAELAPERDTVLATSPDAPFDLGRLEGSWLERPLGRGWQTRLDPDGVTRVYEEFTAEATGWRVLAGLPVDVALGSARAELVRNAWLGLIVLVVVSSLGVLLHRRLARPVRDLRAAIEKAAHDPAVRAPVGGPIEIAVVAEAFNATIAERRLLEERLSHQALHDPLTGLPNRALLQDRLLQALSRRARTGGLVAVGFMDLDRFKLINDTHGHPVGDQVLLALSRRLSDAVRSDDTVARFGGDEFVLVSEGLRDEADATTVALRLIHCLDEPFPVEGHDVHLSGSVGVAVASGGETPDELLRNADAAMYRAKESDRGGFALWHEPLRAGVVSRFETERDLRRALRDNELVLHYQPKCSLGTAQIVGLEALVRWAHPTRGLVGPGDFIPVSEETGLILPIGEWVLGEACRQTARWQHDRGLAIDVAVNLSARQLARPDLTALVVRALEESGIDPADLCLEITEGALLHDTAAVVARLEEIRSLGVRISLDDFGTGYSSLAYLRQLPLDEVKIDRSFVTPVTTDESARAIVASIVGLGHALGLVVVAEGVETATQLSMLRDLGCDLAQGFYLGRPQAAPDATATLIEDRSHTPAG